MQIGPDQLHPRTVLVIDDDPAVRTTICMRLADEGYRVLDAPSADEGLRLVKEEAPGVVVTDVRMEGMDGLTLLQRIKKAHPGCGVIVVTAFGSVEDAVEAMQKGAESYVQKPLHMDQLAVLVNKAREQVELREETLALRRRVAQHERVGRLVGSGRAMRAVFETIHQIAPSDASVLITGESGTGKELVAEAIHALSPRADRPLVRMNCAVFSETLLESELFGHERGSFTGAAGMRKGRFEQAEGGTVFLDDVVVTPMPVQIKLLRVLQERCFERVGGNETLKVDVRIIAATNEPLERAVADGRFRADLYYRLAVLPIRLPPLRERMEDVPLLADHFLRRYCEKNRRPPLHLDEGALARILSYGWPGNVRELENWVERAAVLCRDESLTAANLPAFIRPVDPVQAHAENLPLAGRTLDDIERDAILQTIAHVGGSTKRAAEVLGISLRKLQYRLRDYEHDGHIRRGIQVGDE